MMPKKHKRLYNKIDHAEQQKKDTATKLATKRKAVNKQNKKKAAK